MVCLHCAASILSFNTDNDEISGQSHLTLYQPEAFEPSCLGSVVFGLGTKKSFYFFPFSHSSHHLTPPLGGEKLLNQLEGRDA